MAAKKPLAQYGGKIKEIASTDTIRDVGALSSLTTTDKTSVVAAINEVAATAGSSGTPVDTGVGNKLFLYYNFK